MENESIELNWYYMFVTCTQYHHFLRDKRKQQLNGTFKISALMEDFNKLFAARAPHQAAKILSHKFQTEALYIYYCVTLLGDVNFRYVILSVIEPTQSRRDTIFLCTLMSSRSHHLCYLVVGIWFRKKIYLVSSTRCLKSSLGGFRRWRRSTKRFPKFSPRW